MKIAKKYDMVIIYKEIEVCKELWTRVHYVRNYGLESNVKKDQY